MHKLAYYKSKFGYLEKQGSKEWLNGRMLSFGGSEMATLMSQNKYENWETLKNRKIYKIFTVDDKTEWGHWFEPVSKVYIEKTFGKIHEFGSIPHPYYPVCYSPDGVIVEGESLILLEIKNPIQRGIHKIPPAYLCQVKTGMCILSVEYCLFAQFRFRRCSMKTKPWSCSYDRKYHKEYRNRCQDKGPISFGFLYWESSTPLVDLSNFDNITSKLKNCSRYPKVYIEKENFKPLTGFIMMWKLFDISYAGIKPEHDFLQKQEEILWKLYKDLYCKQYQHKTKEKTD